MSEVFGLTGKVILVTGASSGIGRQAAIDISQNGGTVIIAGRNADRLNETFAKLSSGNHQMILFDLNLHENFIEIVTQLPLLHGVVHSAGITGHIPSKFIGSDDIQQYFNTNYTAPVLLTAALLRKKKIADIGSIVFLSSIATRFPYFGGALYGSSKAALEAYSKVLAIELAPKGIRSNCISPSFVQTPMVEEAGKTISKEVLEKFEKMMPLGFGKPEDVSHAIQYLLSDASKWITGTNLILGGG